MDDKDHQENEVTMDDLEEEFKSISPSDLGGVTEGKGSEAKGSKESVGPTNLEIDGNSFKNIWEDQIEVDNQDLEGMSRKKQHDWKEYAKTGKVMEGSVRRLMEDLTLIRLKGGPLNPPPLQVSVCHF